MIMYGRAPSEALTRSLLTDGHFRSVAGALKSIRISDMRGLARREWRPCHAVLYRCHVTRLLVAAALRLGHWRGTWRKASRGLSARRRGAMVSRGPSRCHRLATNAPAARAVASMPLDHGNAPLSDSALSQFQTNSEGALFGFGLVVSRKFAPIRWGRLQELCLDGLTAVIRRTDCYGLKGYRRAALWL
jgi:hypothetical protein